MHKLFILIAFAMAACGNSADIAKSVPTTTTTSASTSLQSSLPAGFTIVEQSSDGYFIRLASAKRASSGMISELADSFSGEFDRVDLCLNIAHERGDEYLAIIDGKVYDYENNRIYALNTISK